MAGERYPNYMKSLETNLDVLTPIYKFSPDVRKVSLSRVLIAHTSA